MIEDIDLNNNFYFPPILDQKKTNTCVAHCLSTILARYFPKDPQQIPSVLFLYNLANNGEDCGCDP